MIPPSFPHKQLIRYVRHRAHHYGGLRTNHRHFQVWRKLERTDLDLAYPILSTLYSHDQGRPARHPVCMFRSCLAMVECSVTSFTVWEQTLQPIFYACFVARSAELGLIDLENLHVAGDGSKLPTWANSRGKKLCDCDNRGKKPQDCCDCPRAYRDPLARWGWDSYRECWVYGYTMYELTAYCFQHRCRLPLVVSLADCNRHDCVHALAILYHGCETFDLPIQTASLDAAHDALGLFRLATVRWHMALVVPLNERNKGNLQYAGPLCLEAGVPICPAGQPMKRWGFCPDRLRIKWRCPLAADHKSPELTTCPYFGNGCTGSVTVLTKAVR